jgi:glycosyltransferase involved in cell wall biosynthesis
MILGVLLPHTKLYGGVKRFLELGNIFTEMEHEFILFTPTGERPTWFNYIGKTDRFENINQYSFDALWTTTVRFMPMILEANSRHKIFYHVRKSEKVKHLMKNPDVEIFACSSNVMVYDLKKYGKNAFPAIGGVTVSNYKCKQDYTVEGRPFIVMAYGRLAEKVKGTKYVVKACERLYKKGYDIKLLLYDTPTGEKAQKLIDDFKCKCPYEFILNHPFDKNSQLFGRADCFVSAENPKYSGWNNTVSEAMACGLPIITTIAGTLDLISSERNGIITPRKSRAIAERIATLYNDAKLRETLGQNARTDIEAFDWHRLAEKIIDYIQ